MRIVIAILAIATVLLGVAIFRMETSPTPEVAPAAVEPPVKNLPEIKKKEPEKVSAPPILEEVEPEITPPPIPLPKTKDERLEIRWGHIIKLKR